MKKRISNVDEEEVVRRYLQVRNCLLLDVVHVHVHAHVHVMNLAVTDPKIPNYLFQIHGSIHPEQIALGALKRNKMLQRHEKS